MRFTFRLQNVLNWKKMLEESSQTRLNNKTRKLEAQKEKIRDLIEKRLKCDQRLREIMAQGIGVGEYLLYKAFEEGSYADIQKQEEVRLKMTREVERERERLIGLMKEKRVLERVKEKRFKQFVNQMDKLEQKEIDELVSRKSSNAILPNPLKGT